MQQPQPDKDIQTQIGELLLEFREKERKLTLSQIYDKWELVFNGLRDGNRGK